MMFRCASAFKRNVELRKNEEHKAKDNTTENRFALQLPGGNQVDGLPPAANSCRAKMLACFASKQYSCSDKCAEKGVSFFCFFLTENFVFESQNESFNEKSFKSQRSNI